MKQLAFDLPHLSSLGRADFLLSGCNEAALGWIERWPDWPHFALVLHGPAGSGKTHLARVWQQRSGGSLISGKALGEAAPDELAASGAVAVDNAADAPEDALLHLYNCCREAGASLLIAAARPPAQWTIALADLQSRLRATPDVAIGLPDDMLLAAILVKHFADRQVTVGPGVVAYIVRRMERSFAAAARLADRLDRVALAEGGTIGLTLARRTLAEFADQS
jgi:chromosomal replication initiation ATPase DnaA